MFDLNERAIFVTLAGSQAHGTARIGSDVDLRGVCVAPLEVRLSLFERFEQSEAPLSGTLWEQVRARIQLHPTAARGLEVRAECVVYELTKFVALCASANPNALEILFADERDWLFVTPTWRRLHAERMQFLTRKVQQTYLGYALAQLKRIRTHRSWLLTPPEKKPIRADFGLPDAGTLAKDDQNRLEQGIAEKVRSYGIDQLELPSSARSAVTERLRRFWQDREGCSEAELDERLRAVATHALGIPAAIVSTLNAEKKYLAAMKHWESYQTWQAERNEARAALEGQHGFDTKHALHLMRLMRMGLEVLETGELHVRRVDAAELNAIRDGALSYDQLLEAAADLQARMQAAAATSRLPDDIDPERVDRLAFEIIRDFGA
jgi:predicted nucleotidyltransferase